MLLPIMTLAPPVARTANGNGDWLDLLALAAAGGYRPPDAQRVLRVQINVSAISGAGATLTVFLEDCIDGDPATANSVGVTAALTATGLTTLTLGPRGDAYPANFAWPFNPSRLRARWTIAGTTPSVNFSVKGVLL